jgi:hypothetical protein
LETIASRARTCAISPSTPKTPAMPATPAQFYKFTSLHDNFAIFKLRSTTEQMPALVVINN